MQAIEKYNVKNLILAGGVAANSGIRNSLEEACKNNNINFTMPTMTYCTDNAAMIGAAAYYAYKKDKLADLSLNAKANTNLENE